MTTATIRSIVIDQRPNPKYLDYEGCVALAERLMSCDTTGVDVGLLVEARRIAEATEKRMKYLHKSGKVPYDRRRHTLPRSPFVLIGSKKP